MSDCDDRPIDNAENGPLQVLGLQKTILLFNKPELRTGEFPASTTNITAKDNVMFGAIVALR